ncbi:DivIVA domain-containing protein [Leucobacter exalbidus]|uniref:Cell wall synthesis protein Wag31 n=1 Tax=Leucobacter exalbidus TaxID=662960 RepID=A0A940PRI7_9MICO|nr:DivIVA domain-containing protein [Leucobacter exalbidus]MBP1325453.1 DivIVA domain-containing protein [Leucobacter exalbidus]
MHTSFPLATGSEPGYNPDQVDDFLARARSAYEGAPDHATTLTSRDVRGMSFPVKKGGYAARYVDAALDRLEEVFFERERRAAVRSGGEDAWWDDTRALLSEVRGRIERPRGRKFTRRSVLATGYRRSQVDAFLARVGDMFERREFDMKPADVRDVVFHPERRGYDEDQVDALLDAVVDLMLATR